MAACLLRSCLNKSRRKICFGEDLKGKGPPWTQVISETGPLARQGLLLCTGFGETESDISTRKEDTCVFVSSCIPSLCPCSAVLRIRKMLGSFIDSWMWHCRASRGLCLQLIPVNLCFKTKIPNMHSKQNTQKWLLQLSVQFEQLGWELTMEAAFGNPELCTLTTFREWSA